MLNHSGPFCLPKDIFKKICGRFPTILRKRQASLIRRLPSRSK